MAHYVDKNSNPPIVADSFCFLSETFSFYMEKKLEMWLDTKKYKNLILTRRNNRIYYEAKMLKAVSAELYYEEIFKKEGWIKETNIDIENIKLIRNYNVTNLVNYLLQYPLANIISDYLIKNNILVVDKDFADICLSLDLYEILKIYSSNKKRKLTKK